MQCWLISAMVQRFNTELSKQIIFEMATPMLLFKHNFEHSDMSDPKSSNASLSHGKYDKKTVLNLTGSQAPFRKTSRGQHPHRFDLFIYWYYKGSFLLPPKPFCHIWAKRILTTLWKFTPSKNLGFVTSSKPHCNYSYRPTKVQILNIPDIQIGCTILTALSPKERCDLCDTL